MNTNFIICLRLGLLYGLYCSTLGAVADAEKIIQTSFISLDEALPEPHTLEQTELLRDLQFVPPHVDFGIWSVGLARTQTVTLFNQHKNRTVQLNSVSGPSPVFYSSFFGTREVPPQGNTTFNIVFLPRQLGAISTDLLIHTSFGRAEFTVRGEGSECPYRLKPLVGIKAPMNASLTPEIHMYNPHERPLQILEVYSSGGEFQLELPSGGSEGPQNLWEIPPHTLKPIIRISFHGRTAGNHSAFIRIKIAERSDDAALEHTNENVLVIPVEFEILPQHSIYARNPLADFGRLATQHTDTTLHFKLDMQYDNLNTSQLQLVGNYLKNIPGLSFDAHNASIVLDPKLFDESATINDLLVIRSKSLEGNAVDHEFTVLIRADIFKGGLAYDRNATTFITNYDSGQLQAQRVIVVRNNFAFPLTIYNVSMSEPVDDAVLYVSPITQQHVLQPGDSAELLQLHLLDEQTSFKSMLRIATNVTEIEMPLVSCSGKLHVSTQQFNLSISESPEYNLELDLGTVPFAEMSRDGYVLLQNNNPMPIKITNWHFKPPKNVYFQTTFMGCYDNTKSTLITERNGTTRFHFCGLLAEGDTAVFQLSIQTYVAEQSAGILKVWTPYEVIKAVVRFQASVGQLEIEQEQMDFKNCFPGKTCTAVLSIRSTFLYSVHMTAVKFNKAGLRFKDFNAKGTTIAAQTLTKVGRIYFEPTAICGSNCYIKQPLDTETAMKGIFPQAVAGSNNNLLYDGVELRQRTELYRQLKRNLHAMSLTLFSEELPPIELDFSIGIEWPKLVQLQGFANHPAVEIGQVQRHSVVISNPSPHSILLDYFLSDPSYARQTQLSLPHEVIDVTSTSCYLTDVAVFKLTNPPTSSEPILLLPGSSLSIPIEFSAQQPEQHCTLLHVRNNLTMYEAVWLTARAVQSQFRFGNRRPGSQTPLLFQFMPEHFEHCDGSHNPSGDNEEIDPHIVVAKRSFTARNTGAASIRIEGFMIGDHACEDFGFKVIDCQSFELRENETRKVEIAFRSDFTSSRVMSALTLLTNLTYNINYLLLAQLPSENLERCAKSLPRPSWEKMVRNTAMAILLTSFCLVLCAAVFDYRVIMAQQSVCDLARHRGAVQPTFNLRNIAKMQADEVVPALAPAQQQKVKNPPVKDVKKRASQTPVASNINSVSADKPSIGRSWGMDINLISQHFQKSKHSPLAEQPEKALTSTTSSCQAKSSNPSDIKNKKASQSPSPAVLPVKLQKKSHKQMTLTTASAKQKVEPLIEVVDKSVNSKPIVAQQENLLPRLNKPTLESPKERESSQKVLKEQNGSVKKIGKTPGRERRKEQKQAQVIGGGGSGTGSITPPKTERKQQRKKQLFCENAATAEPSASSSSASPEAMNCITSPWEIGSRVSFSDVLQTKQLPDTDDKGLNWNTASCDMTAMKLGPIGSRNGITMASVWEPSNLIGSLPPNVAAVSKPNNFGNMDLAPMLDYSLEERTEFVLKQQLYLQQAQLQRQQEQLLQQRAQMMMDINNWPINNPSAATAWSPLGYSHGNNSWQNQATNVIRPPPGLEANFNTNANHLPPVLNTNSHVNGLAQNTAHGQTNAQEQQYDPFTSPSSIWSDTWRQHQSQTSQQRNNHN